MTTVFVTGDKKNLIKNWIYWKYYFLRLAQKVK